MIPYIPKYHVSYNLHKNPVTHLISSASTPLLVSGSASEHLLRYWRLSTNDHTGDVFPEMVSQYTTDFKDLGMSPDGAWLYANRNDRVLQLFHNGELSHHINIEAAFVEWSYDHLTEPPKLVIVSTEKSFGEEVDSQKLFCSTRIPRCNPSSCLRLSMHSLFRLYYTCHFKDDFIYSQWKRLYVFLSTTGR